MFRPTHKLARARQRIGFRGRFFSLVARKLRTENLHTKRRIFKFVFNFQVSQVKNVNCLNFLAVVAVSKAAKLSEIDYSKSLFYVEHSINACCPKKLGKMYILIGWMMPLVSSSTTTNCPNAFVEFLAVLVEFFKDFR